MPDSNNLPTGNGMQARIARIDERTKHIAERIDTNHDELCKRLDDHEKRLRSLEGSQGWNVWRDIGAFVAAIGAGVAGLSK